MDPAAGKVTFAAWAETWLESLDLKPATRANYLSNLNSRVLPSFGGEQLAKITPAQVRVWQTRLRDEGLSAASIRQARQVLSAALDMAVADGLIVRNPAASVKPPKVRPRRQQFLTAEQVDALAEACDDQQRSAGAVVFFLAWSGLRWGEVVALRWENVDIDRRRVEVRASATEVSGRLEWGSPKTHEVRAVILPQFVIDRLGPPGPPEALVFSAPRGGPLRNSNFRKSVWDPAVKASGMPTDLVPHDLRDTAASLMIASGASIKAVQRALGHSSAAMTLDTYGGLFEDDLEDLADRMEERYA
ncbi:MAG TPA: site-specific integrase [Acidimicrobiia bacterium]|nr:site-specific integrase [Acidimicrobiia bacterium]